MAVAVFIRKASSFFPQVLNQNLQGSGPKEMFNAQLVAALPDGCSSLHQEGVEFFPQVLNQNLQGSGQRRNVQRPAGSSFT